MPEAKIITFTHKEITEMLIKQANIHEGYWAIHFDFALVGGMIPFPPPSISSPSSGNTIVPAAILPVNKIGIFRFDKPNPLTVDAEQANPLASGSSE